jgi:lipopolysaccharide transport system permease protein
MNDKMRNDLKRERETSKPLIIRPTGNWCNLRLGDLWAYRELFYFLAWRDIKVRYKQTVLGVAWAILNPVMQMLVWAFVFGKVAKLPSDGYPYVLITLSGTLVWSYFSEIVNGSAGSLISNTNLITKIYFPRVIIPLSIALRALLDLGIAMLLMMGLMLYLNIRPSVWLVTLPLFVINVTCAAVGIGLLTSALSVKYRDVAKILPYFMQIIFFLTPVAYLQSVIPEKYRWIYFLNPLAGGIEGFRWAWLGIPVEWPMIFYSVIYSFVILVIGVIYFRNLEETFADVI